MKSINFPDSLSVTRNTALHGRSFEYFHNQCCITPFHNNINLTRFLVRDKFVWRGRVLLLANSHKFWYPTLGAIQDLVLQAGATKNPLHQFQTWSHFASQKYQTQVFSKISKSNIPKNIKLKDSQKYQTPKLSEIIKHWFLQKFACSNLLKLSQIFLNSNTLKNSSPRTLLSSAVIFSRWSWVMSRDHWSTCQSTRVPGVH